MSVISGGGVRSARSFQNEVIYDEREREARQGRAGLGRRELIITGEQFELGCE
jgi:hypothetical protein